MRHLSKIFKEQNTHRHHLEWVGKYLYLFGSIGLCNGLSYSLWRISKHGAFVWRHVCYVCCLSSA